MIDTKVHYRQFWGRTLCGLRKSRIPHLVSDDWKEVTCEKCLHKRPIVGNPFSLYQSFHGNSPKRIRKVRFELPKGRLVKVGRLIAVEYLPENPSKRKGAILRHRFGDTGAGMLPEKPILCTDSKGRNLFILKDGAKTYFSGRGIIA